MNVPVLPLAVLDPANQARFRFTIDDGRSQDDERSGFGDGLPATPSFTVSTEVWVVRYEE